MTKRKEMDRDDLDAVFSGQKGAPGSIPGTHPDEAPSDDLDALTRLAALAPPVAPPDGLFGRIEAEIDALETAPVQTVRADEGAWQQRTDKIWMKVLSHDPETGKAIYLLRCAPGAVIPEHVHKGSEFAYVLEGEYRMGDTVVKAGDSQIAIPGSLHPPLESPGGCLILLHA